MPEDLGIGRFDLGSWECMMVPGQTLIRRTAYRELWYPHFQRGPFLGTLIVIGPEGLGFAHGEGIEAVGNGYAPMWIVALGGGCLSVAFALITNFCLSWIIR